MQRVLSTRPSAVIRLATSSSSHFSVSRAIVAPCIRSLSQRAVTQAHPADTLAQSTRQTSLSGRGEAGLHTQYRRRSGLQTRLSPLLARNYSTTGVVSHPPSSSSSTTEAVDPQEPRLSLTFTCTAPITPHDASTSSPEPSEVTEPCSHRSTHTFTKRAYQNGIVIISCPSCKNRHLIADNLGWFKNSMGPREVARSRISSRQKARRYDAGRWSKHRREM